jgi:hypothetical protein
MLARYGASAADERARDAHRKSRSADTPRTMGRQVLLAKAKRT